MPADTNFVLCTNRSCHRPVLVGATPGELLEMSIVSPFIRIPREPSIYSGPAGLCVLIISKRKRRNVVEMQVLRASNLDTDWRLKASCVGFLSKVLLLTGRPYWRCHAHFPQPALGEV